MTYMASCVSTTCDQYDSTNAMWFKIEETGLQPGNMTWYQQNISAYFVSIARVLPCIPLMSANVHVLIRNIQ